VTTDEALKAATRRQPMGDAGLARIRQMIRDRHATARVNETAVDFSTACTIIAVHDSMTPALQAKFKLLPVFMAAQLAFRATH
jgi:hypothetical protein